LFIVPPFLNIYFLYLKTEKMTTTNKETDQHIKTFRASLTDEIAEALSLCNTRLAAAEEATKEMTENSSSATKENLDQISMELKEKLNQMATQLTECKVDKDVVTMTEVDAACSALRSELIRRDELLESQLVDAHAQMTREAQLIVAPAKSQVENMRQQVNSLNERLALATESQGKKHEALNDQLKADVMLNMNTLTTQLNGLVEERQCKKSFEHVSGPVDVDHGGFKLCMAHIFFSFVLCGICGVQHRSNPLVNWKVKSIKCIKLYREKLPKEKGIGKDYGVRCLN
jgi:hypothetical protein